MFVVDLREQPLGRGIELLEIARRAPCKGSASSMISGCRAERASTGTCA